MRPSQSFALLALLTSACPIVVRPDTDVPDASAPEAGRDVLVSMDVATRPDGAPVCAPGTRRCAGSTVETCLATGSGWSSSSCPSNTRCVTGACVCAPRCTGLQCGSDGCGGSCGSCPSDARCISGRCVTDAERCTGDVVRLCYGGPAGTLGRGLCRRGVQRCDGVAWGPCEGDVQPETDTCDDGVDSDCDGESDEDCPLTGRCAPVALTTTLGAVATDTTRGNGRNLRGSCGGASAEDRAYLWTAPESGEYTFSTEGSRFDTMLYLRASCDGEELACNDDATDDVTSSRVTVMARAGQTLLVVVDGFDRASGTFELHVTRGAATPCTPGMTRPCTGAAAATDVGRCRRGTQTCVTGGVWSDACVGEVAPLSAERCGDGVDDTCDGRVDEGCNVVTSRTLSGTITRLRRTVSPDRFSYVAAPDAPVVGARVSVRRGAVVLAQASTDAMGRYTLMAPAASTADDTLVVEAGATDARGAWRFAVARDPGRTEPTLAPFGNPVRPEVWSVAWPLTGVVAGSPTRISDEGGARAFELFNDERLIVEATEMAYGGVAPPMLTWYWPGASWSCGSCFGPRAVDALGQSFPAQLFILGARDSEHVWGRTVATHELGHWVMNTWGAPPREGGTHFVGVLSPPGLAWSEGWATWFGSSVRDDSVHIITTSGVTFWFDIAARATSRDTSGLSWTRPFATQGLLQWLDENELSAMLWTASRDVTPQRLYRALHTRRMTVAPFARGYLNPNGTNVPVLPDFLDALVCGDTPRPAVQRAVGTYPYDVGAPSCEYDAPITVAWTQRSGAAVARVTCRTPLAAPLEVAIRRGANALWETTLRCMHANEAHEHVVGDATGATLTVDLRRLDFGLHAALPYAALVTATAPPTGVTGP